MGVLHLDLKQITAQYGISKGTVLRWKRLGKFRGEDISELEVGKGTIKYLYSQEAIERLIEENKTARGNTPGRESNSHQREESMSGLDGYLLAIDLLKERVDELKGENELLKAEVKYLKGYSADPQQETSAPEKPKAQERKGKKKRSTEDTFYIILLVFALGALAFAGYMGILY